MPKFDGASRRIGALASDEGPNTLGTQDSYSGRGRMEAELPLYSVRKGVRDVITH